MTIQEILTIGECMVEMAPRAEGGYDRNFAGDTFNTAYYLRRCLGSEWKVDFASAVGTDAISDQMVAFMTRCNIGTDQVQRIAQRTVGLYMIELTNGERSFIYWRGQSAAKLLAADRQHLDRAFDGRALILFSGITLAILSEEDRMHFLNAVKLARARGTVIAFDPNMRLRLWPGAPEMCRAITEAATNADIVLPSFDEDSVHFGDPTPDGTVRRYRDLGASTVVVKNGALTIAAWDRSEGEARFQPPPVAQVVDSTAAGDSFNAGFLAAGMKGASLADALRHGAMLSGQVIGKRGALVEVAVPDLGEA